MAATAHGHAGGRGSWNGTRDRPSGHDALMDTLIPSLGATRFDTRGELRLAYVAITRATHGAFLTYARTSPLVERLVA